MNKKANFFLGFVVALLIFINGVLFLPFFEDDVATSRVDLNCSDASSLSSGNKLTCLMIGGAVPYFILAFVSIAIGFVFDKVGR